MLYLQLIAIVLKTQAGERICMVLPEINDWNGSILFGYGLLSYKATGGGG